MIILTRKKKRKKQKDYQPDIQEIILAMIATLTMLPFAYITGKIIAGLILFIIEIIELLSG